MQIQIKKAVPRSHLNHRNTLRYSQRLHPYTVPTVYIITLRATLQHTDVTLTVPIDFSILVDHPITYLASAFWMNVALAPPWPQPIRGLNLCGYL